MPWYAGLIVIAVLLTPLATLGEDRVTVSAGAGGSQVVVRGTVVDWTGRELRMRTGDGVQTYPAEQVIDVESPRLPNHATGLADLAASRLQPARQTLAQALAEEPREWMRREILAALTRADLAAGDRAAAGDHFLALAGSDSQTPYYSLVPLDWTTAAPTAALTAAGRGWLQSTQPLSQLLGASALLFHPSLKEQAARELDDLARVSDPQIYPLARAQLWRQTLATGAVAAGEITRWEDRTAALPEPLRGGPYYLIGTAWANAHDPERAAETLLWLPLVYDSDASLAAAATLQAAEQLTAIGRSADAILLYREITHRWPVSPAAQTARERLGL